MKLIELNYSFVISADRIITITKYGTHELNFKCTNYSHSALFETNSLRDKAYTTVIMFLTCNKEKNCRLHTNDE